MSHFFGQIVFLEFGGIEFFVQIPRPIGFDNQVADDGE